MEPKILINGQEVKNLGDVKNLPPGLQNLLTDDNANGIPDIAENPLKLFGKLGDLKNLSQNLPQLLENIKAQTIIVNGKQYNNWAQIPEDTKAEIKAKFQQMKHLTPTGPSEADSSAPALTFESTEQLSRSPGRVKSEIPVSDSPVIQEKQDSSRRAIFIVALLALAGYLVFAYFAGM